MKKLPKFLILILVACVLSVLFGAAVADEDSNAQDLDVSLSVKVTSNRNGQKVALGETITYTITVTNEGNIAYHNVKVDDMKTDFHETIPTLPVGGTETCTTTWIVTEDDILSGEISNDVTAHGDPIDDPKDPENPKTPENDNSTTDEPEDLNTALSVTLTSDKVSQMVALGETITYAITVTNEGNVAYHNVKVDDMKTDFHETISTLPVGGTETFTTTWIVTEDDILSGEISNDVTAHGDPIDDPKDPENPKTPENREHTTDEPEDLNTALSVTLTSDKVSQMVALGETITYTITVTNEGNVAYHNVKVDDMKTDFHETIPTLPVGGTETCTTTWIVTEDDILSGEISNHVTAQGDPIDDPKDPANPKTPENREHTTDKPEDLITALSVTLTSDKAGQKVAPGEKIAYEIKVRNEGNVAYHNVVITAAKTGLSTTIEELSVGETETFTTEWTVTENDVLFGEIANDVTAQGDPIDDPKDPANPKTPYGDMTTMDEPADLDVTLSVTITSDKAGQRVVQGEVITYTIKVRNEGNVAFPYVAITDVKTGFYTAIGSLPVGETETFATTWTATEAEALSGEIPNMVTAQGDPIQNPKDWGHEKTPEGKASTSDPDGIFTVTYDYKNGTADGIITEEHRLFEELRIADMPGSVIPQNKRFLGWADSGANVLRYEGDVYTVYCDVTFTPEWGDPEECDCAYYNSNYPFGYNNESVVQSFIKNSPVHIRECMFSAPGYVFIGWNSKADGIGMNYVPYADYKLSDNAQLYAQWKRAEIPYTVEYYADGMLDEARTFFGMAPYMDEIRTYPNRRPYGFTLERTENLPLTVGIDSDENVIRVYYVREETIVTTTGGKFTYDGKPHSATVTVSGLPESCTLISAKSSAAATDVSEGIKQAKCDELIIVNAEGEDITDQLEITYIDSTIQIVPATLTVRTLGAEKVYNGTPLTTGGSVTGFVNGETATFIVTGSQTSVGESENSYALTFDQTAKEGNYRVLSNVGRLKVTEYSGMVTVTTTGGTFEYDGRTHGASVMVSGLPAGYALVTAESNTTATDVTEGIVTAHCDKLAIVNAQAEDVTDRLNIEYVDGALEITPAPLTVTTDSAEKVYDGTPLTAGGSVTGLVNGETATFIVTGSRTAVGESENTYHLAFDEAFQSKNYSISNRLGTLKVTARDAKLVIGAPEKIAFEDGLRISDLYANVILSCDGLDVTDIALTEDADYALTVTKDGKPVTTVDEPGVYKLSAAPMKGSGKLANFAVTPSAETSVTVSNPKAALVFETVGGLLSASKYAPRALLQNTPVLINEEMGIRVELTDYGTDYTLKLFGPADEPVDTTTVGGAYTLEVVPADEYEQLFDITERTREVYIKPHAIFSPVMRDRVFTGKTYTPQDFVSGMYLTLEDDSENKVEIDIGMIDLTVWENEINLRDAAAFKLSFHPTQALKDAFPGYWFSQAHHFSTSILPIEVALSGGHEFTKFCGENDPDYNSEYGIDAFEAIATAAGKPLTDEEKADALTYLKENIRSLAYKRPDSGEESKSEGYPLVLEQTAWSFGASEEAYNLRAEIVRADFALLILPMPEITFEQAVYETSLSGKTTLRFAIPTFPVAAENVLWTASSGSVTANEADKRCAIFEPSECGIAVITVRGTSGNVKPASCEIIVHDDSPLKLPRSLTTVAEDAFRGISAREIVMPDSVASVGAHAFADCGALAILELPAGLTDIADTAFDGCEKLTLILNNEWQAAFAERLNIRYVWAAESVRPLPILAARS